LAPLTIKQRLPLGGQHRCSSPAESMQVDEREQTGSRCRSMRATENAGVEMRYGQKCKGENAEVENVGADSKGENLGVEKIGSR